MDKARNILETLIKGDVWFIKRYALDKEGNLAWNARTVQEALLETDDFRKVLVAKCKDRHEEKKKEDKDE